MFAILKKLDPKRAKNIDAKNPRRLIRAIEIAKMLGKIPTWKLRFQVMMFCKLESNCRMKF